MVAAPSQLQWDGAATTHHCYSGGMGQVYSRQSWRGGRVTQPCFTAHRARARGQGTAERQSLLLRRDSSIFFDDAEVGADREKIGAESPFFFVMLVLALVWGIACRAEICPRDQHTTLVAVTPFAVTYVLYFIWVTHSTLDSDSSTGTTGRYVNNIISRREFDAHLSDLQRAQPVVRFSIQCYHYETRTETDEDGNKHEREVRVNTHRASMIYPIRSCTDKTLSFRDKVNARRDTLEARRRMVEATDAGTPGWQPAANENRIMVPANMQAIPAPSAPELCEISSCSSKQNDESRNDDPDLLCQICLDRPNLFAFVPCQHNVVCGKCGDDWLRINSSCIICRRPAHACVRAFSDGIPPPATNRNDDNDAGSTPDPDVAGIITEVHDRHRNDSPRPTNAAVGAVPLDVQVGEEESTGRFLLVHFFKDVMPRDLETEEHVTETQKVFFRDNQRDQRWDQHVDYDILMPIGSRGFMDCVIVCKGDRKPAWLSRAWFLSRTGLWLDASSSIVGSSFMQRGANL